MSTIACRSCGVNPVSIRCLQCMEDRALLCLVCARHHNEIKLFWNHELIPLSSSYHDSRSDRDHNLSQANSSHLNPSTFRPNSAQSLMAMQSHREREEANNLRPPVAYRGLIPSRQGSLSGPGGGPLGPGPHGQGPGPLLNGAGAGAYTSNIRNKVIHVTPATFHLIRSNALLLEDIKTCTGCKIFVSSASSHVTVVASANAVELVGTTVQIEGAIKCLTDLTSALNSSKRKTAPGKFPGDGPEGQIPSLSNSPHLGPQPGPQGPFNPQAGRGPGAGPWPPRGAEHPPQGYPGVPPGPSHLEQRHMNAREQMLAREQLQLQRLYAHSASASGASLSHPNGVGGGIPRLGPSSGLGGSPRINPMAGPVGGGGRHTMPPAVDTGGTGTGAGGTPRPSMTTLSANAMVFAPSVPQTSPLSPLAINAPLFIPAGQAQNPNPTLSPPTAPTATGAAFLRSTDDAEPPLTVAKEDGLEEEMDFEANPGMNFNFEIEGGAAASGSGTAEESSEVEAMSRRFLTGLDEDMNFGLDSYSAFDEPFTFEDTSSKAPVETDSLSLRSLSPENPVLGDSGWDEDGEKVDLFPSPTKRAAIPFAPPSLEAPPDDPDITDDIPTSTAISASLPITTVPAVVIPPPLPLPVPLPTHVPVIITPTNVVIPSGTARFTGFTSTSQQDDDSNPYQTGGSTSSSTTMPLQLNLLPTILTQTQVLGSKEKEDNYSPTSTAATLTLSQGHALPLSLGLDGYSIEEKEKSKLESPSSFTPRSEAGSVKDSIVSGSSAPSARIEWPFSKIGLLTGDSGNAILKDIMENTRTDITVDFGGPPGLPRKVAITGIREADVGLANVLLSDVIATGSYVSFKESAGDNSLSQSLSALSDSPFKDSDAPMNDGRLRSGSFGNISQGGGGGPGFDSLNFFPNGRGIDQANPSPYSALLNSTASQRESAIAQREAEQRERERFGGNPNGFGYDFRQQYPGGPPGPGHIDMEREREQRITAAARFNAASNSGNLAMTPQQQQLQLMQMTSRYPRLFPSASGGLAQPTGPGARAPGPSMNSAAPGPVGAAYPGLGPGSVPQGLRYPPLAPPRSAFDIRDGQRERGFDGIGGYDDRGGDDFAADLMRSESLNRAIEKANASTGVILGEMLCPSEKISLIIGTKGSIINEISRKSNTVISIVDDETRSNPANPFLSKTHRLILIRGSDEGVETARRYIAGVIASGPAYLNVEILSPGSYQNLASNMGMTVVGQEPFRQGQAPPPSQFGRDSLLGLQPPRAGVNARLLGDFDDRYSALSGAPPGLGDLNEFDDRLSPPARMGPPGLTALTESLVSEEENAQAGSLFWGSAGTHSQYGGMDGGRIAPPSQLSFTDLKNAGIMNNIESGNTAPDPNSRRSMARFQTYLDRTHAQQSQQPTVDRSSPASPRFSTSRPQDNDRTYSRTLNEVLDTLTCPLEKIPLLLGTKGATLRRIIDISGADIIINHELPPSVPRILELRGTETQVNSARDMIEEILESGSPPAPLASSIASGLPSSLGREEEEQLSTHDSSHWMSMNASTYHAEGRSRNSDRFPEGSEADHKERERERDNKEKDEYEAMYGKFMTEDLSRSGSPTRAVTPLGIYIKDAPAVFVENNNYDEDDSLGSDDDAGDSTMLTQSVSINSQQLISIMQANLGILDKVANCTGTTVRLVNRNSAAFQSGTSESMPPSPLKGVTAKGRNNLGSHSLDETELERSGITQYNRTPPMSAQRSLSHVVMVSGPALQEVQSGVAVMRKVLHYLIAQSGGTSSSKVITSIMVENVVWPGDTLKDLSKHRTSLIKDIGTTSGAGIVLIKRFTTSKETKAAPLVIPPPALSISFADVLLKREPSLVVVPPVIPIPAAAVSYHHHVVLIGSRFRIAAARTLLEKVMVPTDDSVSSTPASPAMSSYQSNGLIVRIPPPPRKVADSNGILSDSEDENSYDSDDDDESYESGSGDDSYSGNGTTGRQYGTRRNERRGSDRTDRSRDDDSSNVVCILDCPNDKAGLVIGYKGSAIRTMSAKTRAKIVVTDAIINGGVSKRSVKILGTRKQVEKARALVERLMEIGTDAFDEDYNPAASTSLKGVIVPTKETYITSATCSKQAEREARDRDRDREKDKDAGAASYQSVEIEVPTDILKKYLISKNAEVICKEILNRFFVVVTFPPMPTSSSPDASSVVKLRGNRSQLDRAGVYLKRGFGTHKEKEERLVVDTRKRRPGARDRDSDEDIYEVRKSEKADRKVELKESSSSREVTIESGPWKIPERERDRDRERERDRDREDKERKDDFVSVAVTVPCPASRAGCLIGSKGAIVKEIMRRTTARITISDEVILKLSPSALASNKDMTPDPTGYRWVTIKGGDDSVGAADALVRSVIELGAKALSK